MEKTASTTQSAPTAWPLGGALAQVAAAMRDDGAALIGGVEGAARAFALARLWLDIPGPTLVVCPTLPVAETLCRDLEFFLGAAGPVRLFPSYEVSPYQGVDPPAEVTARRLAILWELIAEERPLIVVTSARALAGRQPPPEHLVDHSLVVEPGATLERDELVRYLVDGGYSPAPLVEQVGDFAVRGSVVDFFGPLLDDPVRVEFFGDEIDSVRRFDPVDQRSQLPLTGATLIPCLPVELSAPAVERAVERLRRLAKDEGLGARRLSELVERLERRAPFAGLEGLLPLFFQRSGDLFDYLPEGCRRVVIEPAEVEARLRAEQERLAEGFAQAREEGAIVLAPEMLCRTPAQVQQRLAAGPRLLCRALAMGGEEQGGRAIRLRAAAHTGLRQELCRGGEGSLIASLLQWCAAKNEQGRQVALVCRSRTQVERLAELLAQREAPCRVIQAPAQAEGFVRRPEDSLLLLQGGLTVGFEPDDLPLCFVTEDEIFGAPRIVRQKAPPKLSAMLAALDDLAPGDLVVHIDHGVGRYQGLKTMAVGAAESDFLEISYKDGDRLYLPADRMALISKYRGPDGAAPALDRLGGKAWAKAKGRVKKAVETIAHDLVELYAARQASKGFAFTPPDGAYREFEAGFPYEETPDQAQAIEDVIADMITDKPMDRLVCGDVGYGKTEVALRAAFLAAMQGKQVAFLAPTTVLTEQHCQTLTQRLKDQPLVVESLSRFKTPAQQKDILERLRQGKVDILVGTHRIIQKDAVFKDLGLVIVDEEQRFGVKDKERLKKMRRLVDVITLTATPIPRTLQMSLSGVRDLSVINTPPEDRQSIKTYLSAFSPGGVSEAVARELERGGQVFFVHNRVQDLDKMAGLVRRLAPQARVAMAHGQMAEKELEKVMLQFVHKEVDVLVCTTIIESGLDIPSANTIIINNADKFGLSQIYQLRGRVGRSAQRAYAYLFIKSEAALSSDARKRLKALMDFTQLGSGFAIAMHDMQIRGAGNMLGEAQSGMAAEVGYELYLGMLEDAVARLKGEAPSEGPEPEMNLALPASLPEGFVPDADVRLSLYKRLSAARGQEDVEAIGAELADRFGPPPRAVSNLLESVSLKALLRRMHATRLDLAAEALTVQFTQTTALDLERLLDMAQSQPDKLRVFPDGKVHLKLEPDQEPMAGARRFLEHIAQA
ncbi:transcription-repair coupling factor [Desulfarculus baarsii]|nr:transcription-repair coupling factor [Desulfarculus baarsii]